MKKIFVDYLEISEKYSKEKFLNKIEKKQRYELLNNWLEKEYEEFPSVEEIKIFIKEKDYFFKQFYIKIINPYLKKYLQNEDKNDGILDIILYLIEKNKDILSIIGNAMNWIYSPMEIADKILEKSPKNESILDYKYKIMLNFMIFSIHEIPYGVIDGMDELKKENIKDILKYVDDFEKICFILKKETEYNKNLIDDCRKYYKAWGEYLAKLDKYKNFKEYLDINNIRY